MTLMVRIMELKDILLGVFESRHSIIPVAHVYEFYVFITNGKCFVVKQCPEGVIFVRQPYEISNIDSHVYLDETTILENFHQQSDFLFVKIRRDGILIPESKLGAGNKSCIFYKEERKGLPNEYCLFNGKNVLMVSVNEKRLVKKHLLEIDMENYGYFNASSLRDIFLFGNGFEYGEQAKHIEFLKTIKCPKTDRTYVFCLVYNDGIRVHLFDEQWRLLGSYHDVNFWFYNMVSSVCVRGRYLYASSEHGLIITLDIIGAFPSKFNLKDKLIHLAEHPHKFKLAREPTVLPPTDHFYNFGKFKKEILVGGKSLYSVPYLDPKPGNFSSLPEGLRGEAIGFFSVLKELQINMPRELKWYLLSFLFFSFFF